MYHHLKIFAVIAIASFVLMPVTGYLGEALVPQYATLIMAGVFLLFCVLGFSMVPLAIAFVLRANIALWKKYPLAGDGFKARARDYIMQHEVRIFNTLVAGFWVVYALGMLMAVPAMIKDGFFTPS